MTTFLLPTEPITSLDAYLVTDTGGQGIRRAQDLGAAATIDEVLRSGLRGRGGAGFPTGQKWAGVAAQTGGDACDRISLRSVVVEQGKQSGKAYRFESLEQYSLELRSGKWIAVKAETTQQ